jgi:hypothetical protein
VDRQLGATGFRVDKDCYRHPESPYPIEFPPGPLAVGREFLTGWRTVQSAEGILHVLHPTDSVKDRLAAFIHWNDRSGLSQALAVARAIPDDIDLASIEAWAEGENGRAKFAEFHELSNVNYFCRLTSIKIAGYSSAFSSSSCRFAAASRAR